MNRTSNKKRKSNSLMNSFFRFSTRYSLIFSSSQVLILQRQTIFINSSGLLKHSLQSNGQNRERVSIAFFENILVILYSQTSREDYSSLSSLVLKDIVLLRASGLSLLRVYTISLARAQYLDSYAFLCYQSSIVYQAFCCGFCPCFLST